MATRSTLAVEVGGERYAVEIGEEGDVRVAGLDGAWRVTRTSDAEYLVSDGEVRHRVFVTGDGDRIQSFVEGELVELRVEPGGRVARPAARAHLDPLSVPMPARVVRVLVSEGQAVKRGDLLVTLEAMKMELPLKAPRDGVVRAVACKAGDLVQPGAPVVELA
jgi:biotin carboxyl carrier protein